MKISNFAKKLNKKTLFCFAGFVSLAVLGGCASTEPVESSEDGDVKQIVIDDKKKLENVNVELSAPEQVQDAEVIQVAKSEVPVPEEEEEEITLDDVKWYSGFRNYVLKQGNLCLKISPRKGTFNLLAVNDDGKNIPVLSTKDEFTTSSFYLKAGKSVVKLNDNSAVKYAARKTDTGAQVRYTVDKIGELIVEFNFLKSSEKSNYDMLKVECTVTNIGTKKNDYGLKLVLDTVLGETDRHHFYDSEGKPVVSELLLRDFDENQFFISKNSSAAMQIFVDGKDMTKPALFAMANYDTLNTGGWEPAMISYRTFDTVLSYSNSAASFVWPVRKLGEDDFFTEIFYIALDTNGRTPAGLDYISRKEESNLPVIVEETVAEPVVKEKEPVVQTIPAVKDAPVIPAVKEEPVPVEIPGEVIGSTVEPEKVSAPAKEVPVQAKQQPPAPVEEPKPVVDEQMSSDYIQDLLNRISALEDTGDNVNREELLMLNAELDTILEYLRKK